MWCYIVAVFITPDLFYSNPRPARGFESLNQARSSDAIKPSPAPRFVAHAFERIRPAPE